MARRKDFVSSFLSAVEKEARRAAKEQERVRKIEQREYQKRATLNRNKQLANTGAEQAVRVVTERPCVEYLSLANDDYIDLTKDTQIYPEIINYLKIGKRIEAIEYYKKNTELEYNDIIETIKYLEANLNDIVKDNMECWSKDIVGKYEFCSLQEIINYRQLDSYNSIEIELTCEPLQIKEIVSSKNPSVIQNKSQAQVKKIASKFLKKFHKYHENRENNIIKEIYNQLASILNNEVNSHKKPFMWEDLKDNAQFESNIPKITEPSKPKYQDIKINMQLLERLKESSFNRNNYKLNTIENFLKLICLKKQSEKLFDERLNKLEKQWNKDKELNLAFQNENLSKLNNYNNNLEKDYKKALEKYNKYLSDIEHEKNEFLKNQKEYNEQVDELNNKFNQKDSSTIEDFFGYILEQSVYPVLTYKDFELTYNTQNGILEVDYVLPNLKDIYNIKSISLIDSKNEFKINYLTPKQHKELFDKIVYQICFKTLYEIFNADKNNYVQNIVFNGYSKDIDKKDGQLKTICILSIQVSKDDFENLNLLTIEPKSCFKALKGISAVELASLTPIRPILQFNKEDNRFIKAYDVMETIEDGYNLATMDWQDFENLVREIFEKEFSQNGGEVKVTQSSRDGGVDAIAFDPDPIRGGKIVIQAKRYTNVVGVANVRDLYGTVMNEGAIKGILVTTADYGADSYEFAKDKPLTLLNGGHLLHLLEKHGHKARINLDEAKEVNRQVKNYPIRFYVNDTLQIQSQTYKVHKEDCPWLDKTNSNTYLGEFLNQDEALQEASNIYSPVELCEHCCEYCQAYRR